MTNEKMAFYVAPVTVPFTFVSGISGFDMQFGILDYLSNVMLIAIFSLPIAYIVELIIGLPIYLFFKKAGLINIATLFLGGILVSSSPLFILWLTGSYSGEEHKLVTMAPLFAFIGAIVGFTFWLALNFRHITNYCIGRDKSVTFFEKDSKKPPNSPRR